MPREIFQINRKIVSLDRGLALTGVYMDRINMLLERQGESYKKIAIMLINLKDKPIETECIKYAINLMTKAFTEQNNYTKIKNLLTAVNTAAKDCKSYESSYEIELKTDENEHALQLPVIPDNPLEYGDIPRNDQVDFSGLELYKPEYDDIQ